MRQYETAQHTGFRPKSVDAGKLVMVNLEIQEYLSVHISQVVESSERGGTALDRACFWNRVFTNETLAHTRTPTKKKTKAAKKPWVISFATNSSNDKKK